MDKDKQIEALKCDAASKTSQIQTLRQEILLSRKTEDNSLKELVEARRHVELLKSIVGKSPSTLVAMLILLASRREY